jgi:pimeloyl-ACP methyl ester carboxylesterase
MPLLFPGLVRRGGDAARRVLEGVGVHAPHLAEMWQAYASLTETENRHAFVRTLRAVIDPGGQTVSANDRLYLAAGMPTLIVWGDRDPVIPVQHAYDAHAAMAGSRLEIVEGAGHFPHVEDPRRFVEVLSDFMQSTAPARASEIPWRDLLARGA